jgi:hypothetical protein
MQIGKNFIKNSLSPIDIWFENVGSGNLYPTHLEKAYSVIIRKFFIRAGTTEATIDTGTDWFACC